MNGWPTFYKTWIVLAALAAAYLLYELSEIVVVLFFAIVFASAIRPFVTALTRRGMPQAVAILLIYLVFFILISGLLFLAIPPLISLTIELFTDGLFVTQVNLLLMRLAFLGQRQFQIVLPTWEIPAYMRALVAEAAEGTAQQAWPVAQSTLVVLGQIALTFVMGFYWLTSRQQILRLLLRMGPYHRRADIEILWDDVERTLGAYVRGQFVLMLLIGVVSFAGLMVLQVPHPLALAVIAGLTEAIPVVGPILGAIPAILVAFTVSPATALLVALWYLLVQQLEGNVLVPKIMHQHVGLNPLVVLLALTAGAMLNGVVGAILAIPVAGALQVFIDRLLIQPAIERADGEADQVLQPDAAQPQPDQKSEAGAQTQRLPERPATNDASTP